MTTKPHPDDPPPGGFFVVKEPPPDFVSVAADILARLNGHPPPKDKAA